MKIVSVVMALMTVGSVSFAQSGTRDITSEVTRISCVSVFQNRETLRVNGSKDAAGELNLKVNYKDQSNRSKNAIFTMTSAKYVSFGQDAAVVVRAATANDIADLTIDLIGGTADLTVNGVVQDYLKFVCEFDLAN